MKFVDFKKSVENGEVFPIYLVEGEDAYFRTLAQNTLKTHLITEPSVNYASFEGEALKEASSFSDLLSSLTSYPFMSEKRMTVVSEYYPNKDSVKKLSKILESGDAESSILVIVNSKADESLKKLPSVCVVDCKKAESTTLARWVKATCERTGVEINLETANLLSEYCLCDMARISTETEKLICYAMDKKRIDAVDIDELVYRDSEYKIYEMTDYIAKKQIDNAVKVVFELLEKGETEQRLLISIYNYFRRLLHVSISSMTDAELAEVFSIKEFAVKKAKMQAGAFKITALKKAVDLLEDADYKFKSGKNDLSNEFFISLFSILIDR